jgi:hypothetical protein
VYLLYGSGRLIYIGVVVNGSGIRQEYELASDPLALYRRYLNAQALLFVRRAHGIQRACGQGEGFALPRNLRTRGADWTWRRLRLS